MDDLLQTTSQLLSAAAADPDKVLKWVLIYFGVSSLGFMAVWIIGAIRDAQRNPSNSSINAALRAAGSAKGGEIPADRVVQR